MTHIFILQHVHTIERRGGEPPREDLKLLGAHASQHSLKLAVARLSTRPGFRESLEGFVYDRLEVDKDEWAEGFSTSHRQETGTEQALDPPRWAQDGTTPSGGGGNDVHATVARGQVRCRILDEEPTTRAQRDPDACRAIAQGPDEMMTHVFILHHVSTIESGGDELPEEELKLIGAYSSEESVALAIPRLSPRPGFCDFPNGFVYDRYELGRDEWAEGFSTWYPEIPGWA